MIDQSVVCPILIGRHAPLNAGAAALARAQSAQGSTLLISGEAGIGKSRVVRALVDQARTDGFVTLTGACFEADRAHPYAPILDLVRVLAAITSPALAAHYFAPAANDLVTLFPELQSIFVDATVRETLGPEEDRRRLYQSFGESIRSLAQVQPLLLVIEDVHWSDDATLDLLLHIARGLAAQRITLVLTFRSDEVGPRLTRLLADLDRARCAADIPIRSLAVPEVAAMLTAIFGSEVILESAFVQGLHELTEGNPFFVEEMLKAMMVVGDISRTDGIWRARPLEHIRVPRTASEAVGRRLAGLSNAARRVASVAAVAGRRFDFQLLQSLTQHADAELFVLVKELISAQLVVEESADRFAFRHALTRETMRAQLLTRERIALHAAIGASLEARYDERVRDMDDDLSYHMFESGAWAAAVRYATRAADHAWTLCAPREALLHLERAVAANTHVNAVAPADLLIRRGRAHETLGSFQQAHDDFTAAFDTARHSAERNVAWVALHALGMLWAARDYERAGKYRRDALALARSLDDATLIARSLNRIGNWYVNREQPNAGIPYHDEALGIFERADDRRGVAETVDLLAMAHHIAGAESAAGELYERAVLLFTALEDRRGLANALAVLGVCGPSHHASAGPVHVSVHAAELLVHERAVRLASEISWRAGEAFARYLLADCLTWRGEYDRAFRLANESLTIATELDHLEWQCGARRVLGMIALDLCAESAALSPLQIAHGIAIRLASATWIRWTGAPYAIALARAGEIARATLVLDEIDRLVPVPSMAGMEINGATRTLGDRYLSIARGEVALAAGDPERVLAWVSAASAVGTPRASLLRAHAFAARQQWSDATLALDVAHVDARRQHAHALLWRVDALQGAVHLGARRRLEARASFDAARASAAELCGGLAEPTLISAFRAGVDQLAPPASERTARQVAKAAHGGLTRRECDTAAQIAHGKSNRAIAQQLGIGERTVEGHVASAMSKLGFVSRAQIAVWAVEQGLAAVRTSSSSPRKPIRRP